MSQHIFNRVEKLDNSYCLFFFFFQNAPILLKSSNTMRNFEEKIKNSTLKLSGLSLNGLR